jgi:hypothetical protein
VFVRELVPRPAIAWVARALYDEPYRAVPMRSATPAPPGRVTYEWRAGGRWQHVAATTVAAPAGAPAYPEPDSEAAFVTEHYWGYTRRRGGRTTEYEVTHPRWRVWPAERPSLDADVRALYGEAFVRPLSAPPTSALVAEGSSIAVYPPSTAFADGA